MKKNTRRQRKQQFSRQMINAHESERRRIAAELHDSIGQSLMIIKNLALLGNTSAKDRTAAEQFESIVNQSTEAIADLRNIIYDLRPYLLNKLGLSEQIKILLDKIASIGSIKIHSNIDNIDNLFSEEAEINIYRIVQECLNNILKHAAARETLVEIIKNKKFISIQIRDDGCGFEPDKLKSKRFGFGLLGISERVRMMGGEFTIKSEPSRGTTVLVDLKFGQTKKARLKLDS